MALVQQTDDDSASTVDCPMFTPAATVIGEGPPPGSAIPWPDNIYLIVDKASRRVVTRHDDGGLFLQERGASSQHNNRWLCVQGGGYFGFMNPRSGRYMGHDGRGDGKSTVHARVMHMKGHECMVPRQRPEGGYQLLMPLDSDKLMLVEVAEDGQGLVRRHHGCTVWEFERVPAETW